MQVLNVALGGTLIDDLAAADGDDVHRGGDREFFHHEVELRLAAGSPTSTKGRPRPACPRTHHQALDTVAGGLRVAADGIVEAVEGVGGEEVLGVQWHPEEGEDFRIFDAFIGRVAAHRERRQESVGTRRRPHLS